MLTLKQDNERLHRQVDQKSAVSSPHHTVDRRGSHRRSPADEASVITGRSKLEFLYPKIPTDGLKPLFFF